MRDYPCKDGSVFGVAPFVMLFFRTVDIGTNVRYTLSLGRPDSNAEGASPVPGESEFEFDCDGGWTLRLAVVGTRTFDAVDVLTTYLDRRCADQPGLTIVSGGAPGADRLAAEYAERKGVPLVLFRADWAAHGRRAGAIRNRRIVDNADALVAFWDELSPGTKISLEMAVDKGIPATVVSGAGFEYEYGARSRQG